MLTELCSAYYKEMGKRVRKKRSRTSQSSFKPVISGNNTIGVSGWNIRYDFKMAFFAEMMLDSELSAR